MSTVPHTIPQLTASTSKTDSLHKPYLIMSEHLKASHIFIINISTVQIKFGKFNALFHCAL
jgi:hypothetical protein